jgi:hypothetical protein
MPSSINTMMHGVRGLFRFAHIDGLIPTIRRLRPAAEDPPGRVTYPGPGPARADPISPGAQTLTVHHGALAYLLGINALRASEAAAVRIEDYRETLRGHRVLHLVGKGSKPATMPLTVRSCASSRDAAGDGLKGRWCCVRCRESRSTVVTATGWSPGSRRPPVSLGTLRSRSRLLPLHLLRAVPPPQGLRPLRLLHPQGFHQGADTGGRG